MKKHLSILAINRGNGSAEKSIELLLPRQIVNYNVRLTLFQNPFYFDILVRSRKEFQSKNQQFCALNKMIEFLPVILEKK